MDRCGKVRLKLWQHLLDGIDDGNGVGAGLALDVQDDGWRHIHPGALLGVLHAVYNVGDVSDENRSAVAIGDYDILILRRTGDLVVGVDLIVLARPIEIALG